MTLQPTSTGWEQKLFALAQAPLSMSREGVGPGARTVQNKALDEAFTACEAITAEHSRSFYRATSLLPGDKRSAMRALYAFCRTADNLADGDVEQPQAKLYHLRAGITGRIHSGSDAVLLAWSDTQARYQIPLVYAEQLLDGVERDLMQQRYQTFEDLTTYCYGVASTVGLMSMHITGFSNPAAILYAIKLGVALQLTNILRDVAEDWQAGRCYLPLDELAAFGLSEQDIAVGNVTQCWREFMRFQINRARRLYAEALPGIAMLEPDGRFSVAAAALLYQGILDDIEAHDFNVFHRRAYVSRGQKAALLLRAYRLAKKSKTNLSNPGVLL